MIYAATASDEILVLKIVIDKLFFSLKFLFFVNLLWAKWIL